MRHRSRAKKRGAVIVEYSLLLTVIAIPAIGGLLKGGQAMWDDYTQARTQLLLPLP